MLTDGEQADLLAFLESLTGAPLPDEMTRKPVLPGLTGGGGAGNTTGTTGWAAPAVARLGRPAPRASAGRARAGRG